MFRKFSLFHPILCALYDFAPNSNDVSFDLGSKSEEKVTLNQISIFEAFFEEIFISSFGTISIKSKGEEKLDFFQENLVFAPFWVQAGGAVRSRVTFRALKGRDKN